MPHESDLAPAPIADIDFSGGMIRVTFAGPITISSWARTCQEVASHPLFDAAQPTLWVFDSTTDLRGVTGEGLRIVAGHVGRRRADPKGKPGLAIVASDDLTFGMARMFGGLAGEAFPLEVEVFREIEAAESWLTGTRRVAEPVGSSDPPATQESGQ